MYMHMYELVHTAYCIRQLRSAFSRCAGLCLSSLGDATVRCSSLHCVCVLLLMCGRAMSLARSPARTHSSAARSTYPFSQSPRRGTSRSSSVYAAFAPRDIYVLRMRFSVLHHLPHFGIAGVVALTSVAKRATSRCVDISGARDAPCLWDACQSFDEHAVVVRA
jgi:hypothetical protein